MDIKNYNKGIKEFIKGHLKDDPFSLSLSIQKSQDIPVDFAIKQIQARQKAKNKLPSWYDNPDLIFPSLVSVEQSSSERTAAYKASLFTGDKFVDLTGGMGVDCTCFAGKFGKVYYVEQNDELVEIAKHNFNILRLKNIQSIHSSAEKFLQSTSEHFDLIYLDPGRRPNNSKKTFLLEESSPNVLNMLEKLFDHSNNVLLKLSPLLDIKYAIGALKYVSKVWVVALNNECKELLVSLDRHATNIQIQAIDIGQMTKGFAFNYADESNALYVESEPLKYLYEPNAAVLKAGAFKVVSQEFGVNKLHRHTHLYTSNSFVDDFPGRKFLIKEITHPNKKAIKKLLPEMRGNIAVRNFPMKPEALKKKWGIVDGGDDYIFAVTTKSQKKLVLICEKI